MPPKPPVKKSCYRSIRFNAYIYHNSQPSIPVFRDLFHEMSGTVDLVFSLVRRPDGSIDPLCLYGPLLKHLTKMFCKFHKKSYHPEIEKAISRVV